MGVSEIPWALSMSTCEAKLGGLVHLLGIIFYVLKKRAHFFEILGTSDTKNYGIYTELHLWGNDLPVETAHCCFETR